MVLSYQCGYPELVILDPGQYIINVTDDFGNIVSDTVDIQQMTCRLNLILKRGIYWS